MGSTMVVVHRDGTLDGALKAAGTIAECAKGHDRVVLLVEPNCEEVGTLGDTYGKLGMTATVLRKPLVVGMNAALRKAQQKGDDDWISIHESDVVVETRGWKANRTAGVVQFAAVGPAGPKMMGAQRITPPDTLDVNVPADIAEWQAQHHQGRFGAADTLSTGCLAIYKETIDKLGELDETLSWTWAWRDWWLRLHELQWRRPMVALGVYASPVGRPHVLLPDDANGRIAYYRKHWQDREESLCGVLVVQPQSDLQAQLIRRTIDGSGCDGFVLLLVGDVSGFGGWDPHNLDGVIDGLIVHEAEKATSVVALEAQALKIARVAGYTWAVALREGEVLPGGVPRCLDHPDPLVYAYNVSTRTLWGGDVIRIDKPYGDGGDLTDQSKHASDRRIVRLNSSHRFAADGTRAAACQLLNGYFTLDTEQVNGPFMAEPARHTRPSIGLHMLCYSRTDLDDVGRWLDWTFGLVDQAVIVWTDHANIPAELRELCTLMGAELVEVMTDDTDFATWRNKGLSTLRTDYAWFVDPDEWVDDPLELIPVRRLVDRPSVPGWLFTFHNWRDDGRWSESHATRLHVLDDGIRFTGRVHESPGRALTKRGTLQSAPILVYNRGSYGEVGNDKDQRYLQIMRAQLEDDPTYSQHWVSLAWAYRNAGHVDEAITCLDRAIEHAPETAYLAHMERATVRLQLALPDLVTAAQRVPLDNPRRQVLEGWLSALRNLVPVPEAVTDPDPLPCTGSVDDAETGGRSEVHSLVDLVDTSDGATAK